jgi:preprotein translocase subunit SecA
VDWCREDLQVPIVASAVADLVPEQVQHVIRETAKDEARESITRSIGEYIDPEADPSSWDLGGLQSWAQRAYKVAVSKNQLRRMDAEEITDLLIEAAEDYYDHLNLDAIVNFTDPDYPCSALIDWAHSRFEIELNAAELTDLPSQDVAEKIEEQVRRKYATREIEYPVDYTLARSVAVAGTNQAVASQAILDWANSKYDLSWKPEHLEGRKVQEIRDELVKLNQEFLEGGRLEAEVDQALAEHQGEELLAWASKRFGPAWSKDRFDTLADDPRRALIDVGRHMLTWELALLEHRVLLQLYDQMWKDHLLEMDRLEDAIKQRPLGGDQTHPQSQYAIEGRELFDQMWSRLRARIVDVILKVHAPAGDRETPSAPTQKAMEAMHADATGAGFAGAATDYQSAMQAQGGPQKAETIRREQPKVGRNAPGPCGSGKKFKHCHGKK